MIRIIINLEDFYNHHCSYLKPINKLFFAINDYKLEGKLRLFQEYTNMKYVLNEMLSNSRKEYVNL